MAQVEKLSCDSCGAPLEVPRSANFVTCQYCNNQLKIHRSPDVAYTETLQELTEHTAGINQRLDKLNLHQEIANLDREWESQRQTFMVRGKDGREVTPNGFGAVFSGIAITVFGIFWTIMAFSITSSAPDFPPFSIVKYLFPMFGVVFVVAGIVGSAHAYTKSTALAQAERQYRQRRSQLLRQQSESKS